MQNVAAEGLASVRTHGPAHFRADRLARCEVGGKDQRDLPSHAILGIMDGVAQQWDGHAHHDVDAVL